TRHIHLLRSGRINDRWRSIWWIPLIAKCVGHSDALCVYQEFPGVEGIVPHYMDGATTNLHRHQCAFFGGIAAHITGITEAGDHLLVGVACRAQRTTGTHQSPAFGVSRHEVAVI